MDYKGNADACTSPRRDLRLFLTGQTTSVFGNVLTGAAVSIVAVTVLHGGSGTVALITIAGLLPVLLAPVAGVYLDRVAHPRRMLLLTDLISALGAASCAIAALVGILSVWWLVGLNVVLGSGSVVVEALYFPHLAGLGVRDLGAARGKLQSTEMLARSGAASVAGPVAALMAAPLLFLGDAISYAVNATCLLMLRAPDARDLHERRRRSPRREFVAGIAAVRRQRLLLAYLVNVLLAGTATSGIAAQRAVFLLHDVRMPVALFTVPMLTATLAGAVSSRIAPALMRRRVPPGRLLLVTVPGGALAAGVLPTAGGPVGWVVAAACLSAGLGLIFAAASNIAVVTMISEQVGDEYFARVATLLGAVAGLAGLIGAGLGGGLGDSVGARAGIWACVGIGVVSSVTFAAMARCRTGAKATVDLASGHAEPAALAG